MRKFLFFLFILVMTGYFANATTMIRRVSLEQMTADAQTIFLGKCVKAESFIDENGLPATRYQFEIQQALKGSPAKLFTIKQFGIDYPLTSNTKDLPVLQVEGMPRYKSGSAYLLFMTPPSSLGFSSPQGLSQGAFLTYQDPKSSRAMALNGMGNSALFSGPSNSLISVLHESSSGSLTEAPVPLQELLQMVRQILDRK